MKREGQEYAQSWFEDCRRGAPEAAPELGFTLLGDGPSEVDVAVGLDGGDLGRDGVPVIAVSVERSS